MFKEGEKETNLYKAQPGGSTIIIKQYNMCKVGKGSQSIKNTTRWQKHTMCQPKQEKEFKPTSQPNNDHIARIVRMVIAIIEKHLEENKTNDITKIQK